MLDRAAKVVSNMDEKDESKTDRGEQQENGNGLLRACHVGAIANEDFKIGEIDLTIESDGRVEQFIDVVDRRTWPRVEANLRPGSCF